MFEEFPQDEYHARLARVQAGMRDLGLDGLLLTTEINLRYLAGVVNCYWACTMADDVQAALIPAAGTRHCVLLAPDHLCYGPHKSSWIQDRRAWSQFSVGQLPGPVRQIADTMAAKSLDRGRVGIEIGRNARLGMSPAYFEHLRDALPHCEFVDCEDLLSETRAVKTTAEIACIRRACEITCEGMLAGLDAVAENVSEIEIGKAIVGRWAQVADDFSSSRPWFMFIYSTPQRTQWFDCGPTDYRLRKGDATVIDIGYCYKGYWADFFRTACIGDPAPVVDKFFHGNRAANLAGMAAVRPGVTCGQIAQTVVAKWREIGLGAQVREQLEEHDYDFVGHGLGLSVHDLPFVNTQQTRKLEAGMYLALEGMLTDHMPFDKATAALGIEDDILVTPDGCERLTAAVPDTLLCK